jgi:iron complex outermembrane recepter protein
LGVRVRDVIDDVCIHPGGTGGRRRGTAGARGSRAGKYLGGVLLIGICASATSTLGQEAELEQVFVTGSRIARPDFDSASPIVSVTQELFQRTGSSTVETAINTLPQFVPAFTSTSNNPGNGGQANVALRGLGPTSTLVLVDGKRLMPANGNGVADLNIIPSSLIESVEIITGGASAVYGSDALAGVVNFKLKRKFDGVEIDGTWGQTDRGDATQYEAALTAGTDFAGGRGSIIGAVGYADRELVTLADRDFSKYELAYIGPGLGTLGPGRSFLPGGSQAIEEGRANFFDSNNLPSKQAFDALMTSYDAGAVPYPQSVGFNTDGTLFTLGDFFFFEQQEPAVANYRGARDPMSFNEFVYLYNFVPQNALQLPLERTSAYARAEFELTESTRVYAQALYADYSVSLQLAPTPAFDMFMPVSNAFIPDDLRLLLDSRPEPGKPLEFAKRMSELGPRISRVQYDVFQATLGVAGSVLDDWDYEAYVQVGANDQSDHQTGNVLTSKIEELTFAPDGGVSICGGFNPFGLGSISRECLDYIEVDAFNHAAVDQTIVEASFSGPLAALPAGDLRVALGAFYKEDKYEYAASPVASIFVPVPGSTCPPDCRPDIQGFNASRDLRGNDHNIDLYVEVLLPVLADVPGVRSLETVLGYRLSDYASAGSFDSWKAELLYQPIDGIRVRGSFQEAVRAASVSELYLPQLPAFFDYSSFEEGVEPCDFRSAQRSGPDAARVEALCVEHGVPEGALPTFQPPEFTSGVAGGNPDLEPEEATTITVGVVWTSRISHPLLSNLQVSLDWYRIDIADRITEVPFEEFVTNCYDPAYNPDFSVDSQWCTYFRRDGAGEIKDAQALLRNDYDWETDGLDMQLDWRFDLGPGQLGVTWLVAWVDSWTIEVDDGTATAPPDELAGTIGAWIGGSFSGNLGASFPEWKSNLHLSYAWRDLTLGATWRYIDAMTDADTSLSPAFRVPSMDYFDLDASYEFAAGVLGGLSLGVGVENLTDGDPPIFPSHVGANTDPSQYDVFGRRYYASLRYSF